MGLYFQLSVSFFLLHFTKVKPSFAVNFPLSCISFLFSKEATNFYFTNNELYLLDISCFLSEGMVLFCLNNFSIIFLIYYVFI